MKMFLISDNTDSLVGMRLAGIEGILVHEREELISELERAVADSSIAVILITEKLATMIPDEMDKIKIGQQNQLIVEIPDRHGSMPGKKNIMSYVKDAIGIKI